MKNTLLLPLLLFFRMAYSQDYIAYYNLVNEAAYQHYLGKDDIAYGLFEKAFAVKKVEAKANDIYLFAKLLLLRNEKTKAIFYLQKIPSKVDGSLFLWLHKDSIFFSTKLHVDEFISLKENAKQKEDEWNIRLTPWLDSVKVYMHEDQRLRKVFVDSISPRFEEGQRVYHEFVDSINENDIKNQIRFLHFIKTYGYPGKYMTGSDYVVTLLLHLDCSLFAAYKTVLLELLKQGKVEPFSYASMVDRIGCACEGKSMYKAYRTDCDLTWETILQNRESIGLNKYFQGPNNFPYKERSLLKPD